MKDTRETYYDATAKVKITIVDVTSAAQALARGHLCGPTSAYYLTEGLASVALLGSELTESDETVILQMKCKGPLGGFNVECTKDGKLRGYTEKKTLDDFDGLGKPKDEKVLASCLFQITRSVPGKIVSQGVATTLNGYLHDSLQRNACLWLEAAVSDDVMIGVARGVLVELLPDSAASLPAQPPHSLSVSPRNLLAQLGFAHAERKSTEPLSFACRCSSERAVATLSALSEKDRKTLPDSLDITCHMCGRTFTVRTK